jgi:hypothetical protein
LAWQKRRGAAEHIWFAVHDVKHAVVAGLQR